MNCLCEIKSFLKRFIIYIMKIKKMNDKSIEYYQKCIF